MTFWSFDFVWAFLALPPILYCLYRCKIIPQKRYFPHLKFFANPQKWRSLEWILTVVTLLLMIGALATPVVVDFSDPRNRNGIDIVLSLDGSGSMNASGFSVDDSRSTRFEIVQKIAQDFVMKRREDNVGVVLFGDFAFIATPVTYEKEIIAEMIGYLNFGMAGQNTAIGEGVAQGVRALQDSKAKSKIIILLTDGEHNSGAISPKEAVEMVRKAGIKLYTIGIGTKGEFDSKLLEQMAHEGGGEYFSALNEKELKEVYNQIDTLEKSRIKSAEHTFFEHYFQYPLAGALLMIVWLMWRRRGHA
ncbi:MAG: VWA domain-containing protein [Sulfuricurvum sp.]|uniref:vWA domain-containing protein n=1 Tax=Sulfuricurvum sp. TaxID=2025608 RepID=UPI00260DD78B|nr:VWA domain-containing protein [Sulfuricurvum sp.]MDD2829386.1 VWA domain-containing protein [Sulfuricurvum sp.]MDD4949123.1 VWA domain-containing protein [Sulfuricurvum sp.]